MEYKSDEPTIADDLGLSDATRALIFSVTGLFDFLFCNESIESVEDAASLALTARGCETLINLVSGYDTPDSERMKLDLERVLNLMNDKLVE